MTIGERIKFLRTEKGITQSELAKTLNIARSTLSQYESNQRTPSDDMKLKLSSIFNVSIDYLLGLTDIPYTQKTGRTNRKTSDEQLLETKPTTVSFEEYLKKYNVSDSELDMIKAYLALPYEARKSLVEFFKALPSSFDKKKRIILKKNLKHIELNWKPKRRRKHYQLQESKTKT
ncbi:MAG: helix-turn-helix domain-containing protein [Clostridium sp.]